MIHLNSYQLSEVIPQSELNTWRDGLKKTRANNCSEEVCQFIDALAAKLPDFGRIGEFHTPIPGQELLLSGVKEMKGEPINSWTVYDLPVPRMVAVDHHSWMHRIYARRGKQGLIDYCKAQVKGTELERLLAVLTVHVFHQEREEYKTILQNIQGSKKLDLNIEA